MKPSESMSGDFSADSQAFLGLEGSAGNSEEERTSGESEERSGDLSWEEEETGGELFSGEPRMTGVPTTVLNSSARACWAA